MDENVIYNQTNQDPASTDPPPADPAVAAVDPAPPQEVPADDGTAGGEAPPADGTPPPDGSDPEATEEEYEEPPTGIAALFAGGRLKKIIIGGVALLILIILIAIFIPKQSAVKNVELTWWGLWEDSRVMQAIISDFERENPNIKVKYTKQDPKQYRDRLLARIANGTGPDIFRYHNTWYPMMSEVLLPLSSDVITPEEFEKVYYPVMQNDLIQNGAIFGIPLGVDVMALFINTKILEDAGVAPPRDWREFREAAAKLTIYDTDTEKITQAGAALGTFNNIEHAPDIVSIMFAQQGVEMKTFTNDTKKQQDALDFYTSFARGNKEEVLWDRTLDNSLLAFSRESLAMYFGYSWDIFRIQSINKDIKFKVYPIPGLVNKNQSIASYWVEGVNAKSPNSTEALLFMQYLAKKETAQKFYAEAAKVRGFGEPYARRDLANSLKDNELVYPFINLLPNATSSYFVSNTYDGEGGLNFLLNQYLGTTITAMVERNTSGATLIETLNAGVTETYEKYGIVVE